MTMAYILAVNPKILGNAGMDPHAVLIATTCGAILGTSTTSTYMESSAGIAMPLFYSISEAISLGIISYVIINLICGKRGSITPLMYVLAVLFLANYIFL